MRPALHASIAVGQALPIYTTPAMNPVNAVIAVAGAIRASLASLIDAIPPYHIYVGPLTAKVKDDSGRAWIRCGGNMVEVDAHTYGALEVGERLRLRYTRGKKAVSIDKLVPSNDLEDFEH